MRGLVVAVLCVVGFSTPAFGKPFERLRARLNAAHNHAAAPVVSTMSTESSNSWATSRPYADNSTAQGVAELQARSGSNRHFGGNTGYEGVGFSTRSADDAIRSCCYWGRLSPRDIGVARGPNGWYACVRYH